MPLVLLRVDERLIHGQVVVGWSERLRLDRIVVAEDVLAASDWEQDLYRLGIPVGTASEFVSVFAARGRLDAWRSGTERVLLLLRNVVDLVRLSERGILAGEEVNLGGVHHASGRERLLPYLFLSPEEQQALRGLEQAGVRISARDLPDSRRVPLEDLLSAR